MTEDGSEVFATEIFRSGCGATGLLPPDAKCTTVILFLMSCFSMILHLLIQNQHCIIPGCKNYTRISLKMGAQKFRLSLAVEQIPQRVRQVCPFILFSV